MHIITNQHNNEATHEVATVIRPERKHIPYLECLMEFFNLQDMCELTQVNHALNKQISVDQKRFRYMDRSSSSLITACYVQKFLYNTEKNPMTWEGILKLVKLERVLKIKITPFSFIHHVTWNNLGGCILQKMIRCIQVCPMESLSENVTLLANNPRKCLPLSRELQTAFFQVEGHELAQLRNYTSLHQLELKIQTDIDRDDLAQVASLAGTLKSLCLHLSPDSENNCLQTLAQLTGLTHLELGNLRENAHLNALSNLTSLKFLSFVDCQMTGENLNALTGLTVLHTLHFTSCKKLSMAHVLQLVHLTALQNLSFTYGCPLDAEKLGQFTSLRDLTIYKLNITNDDLAKLNTLCNLQRLTLVPSASCRQITVSGLNQLNGLTALRELNLRDITLDEEEPIDVLWHQLPALQNLNMIACRMQRQDGNHSDHASNQTYTRPHST